MHSIGKFCTVSFPRKPSVYAEEISATILNNSVLKGVANVSFQTLKMRDKQYVQETHILKNTHFEKSAGDATEERFLTLLKNQGLEVRKANHNEDYFCKFDLAIELENKEILIDVKGMKALRRNGLQQNKCIFVEVHNEGWLHSGKSDYIAFEFNPNVFLLYDKECLKCYVQAKINNETPFVSWPEQCYEKIYVRSNPRVSSALTLLNTLDSFAFAGVGKVGELY